MRNGFTLVELSIVLVIIGLLIGGILVGQSMIDASKLNAFVRQMQSYDVAVMNFKGKYKSLPSESGLVVPVRSYGSTPAAKDGLITDDDMVQNTTYFDPAGSDEYIIFWKDLAALVGLPIKNCPNIATIAPTGYNIASISGAACNMAKANYGANKNIMIIPSAYTVSSNLGNMYYFFECGGLTSNWGSCTPPLTQAEVMAYDAKIDDGIPNTGIVQGGTRASGLRPVRSYFSPPSSYDSTSTTPNFVMMQKFANGL